LSKTLYILAKCT